MANNVIIFSKDRPLQLQSLLESFYHQVTGYDQIYIIVDKIDHYIDFRTKYHKVNWIIEKLYNENGGGFDTTLRDVVNRYIRLDDNILFLTDDVIITRPIDLMEVWQILEENQDAIGFSFRLGKNILGYNKIGDSSSDDKYIRWNWPHNMSHWGYFFDVSCSMYRASLVRDIVNYSKTPLIIPNSLESLGVNLGYKGIFPQYVMMAHSKNSMVIVDLNLCQDLYKNPHHGNESTTVESFLGEYKLGKRRIKWENYLGMSTDDPFIGLKNFELIER